VDGTDEGLASFVRWLEWKHSGGRQGAPDVDVLGGKNFKRGGSQATGVTRFHWAEGKADTL